MTLNIVSICEYNQRLPGDLFCHTFSICNSKVQIPTKDKTNKILRFLLILSQGSHCVLFLLINSPTSSTVIES